MSNRLEIRLYEEDNEVVSLSAMSATAVDSFVRVINALKELAVSTLDERTLTFSIEEGSALAAVSGQENHIRALYSEIDTAIKGQSQDEGITTHLRVIQKEVKKSKLGYDFHYIQNGEKIELHEKLINSNRISIKRKPKSDVVYELKVIGGFFNQIGGKDPNYHFDFGDRDKLTIECNIEQAKSINQYLYTRVDALLISKQWNNSDRKEELTHKIILESGFVATFKSFLNEYNKQQNIVDKLTVLYDFVDQEFGYNSAKFDLFRVLLVAFNDDNFHLSELKTLLVISKPFKNHPKIESERKALFETYSKKKSK